MRYILLEDVVKVPSTEVLIRTNLVVSVVLTLLVGTAWMRSGSQLALAQTADGLTDAVVSLALFWAVRVARKPADPEHPFGHHGAEPLAALLAAGVATALSVEVVTSAITALHGGARSRISTWVLVIFGARVALRGAVWWLACRAERAHAKTPLLAALRVDARNDVLVSAMAFWGAWTASRGWPSLDAWAALPLGVWIGVSGLLLAQENVALLMGQAPSEARQTRLLAKVQSITGVLAVDRLRARAEGRCLFVWVNAVADARLTLEEAEHIRLAIEACLEQEADVATAVAVLRPTSSRGPPAEMPESLEAEANLGSAPKGSEGDGLM